MVIKIINVNRFAATFFICFKLVGFIIENNFHFQRVKTVINSVGNITIYNDLFFFYIIILFQVCDVIRHFSKTRHTDYKIIIFFWKVYTFKNISIAKIENKPLIFAENSIVIINKNRIHFQINCSFNANSSCLENLLLIVSLLTVFEIH